MKLQYTKNNFKFKDFYLKIIYSTFRNNKNKNNNQITIFQINIYLYNLIYLFITFFNLFWSNKLIEDNRAILWLSGWVNCDDIVGAVGGGGGGGGMVVKDDELTATTTNWCTILIKYIKN